MLLSKGVGKKRWCSFALGSLNPSSRFSTSEESRNFFVCCFNFLARLLHALSRNDFYISIFCAVTQCSPFLLSQCSWCLLPPASLQYPSICMPSASLFTLIMKLIWLTSASPKTFAPILNSHALFYRFIHVESLRRTIRLNYLLAMLCLNLSTLQLHFIMLHFPEIDELFA